MLQHRSEAKDSYWTILTYAIYRYVIPFLNDDYALLIEEPPKSSLSEDY